MLIEPVRMVFLRHFLAALFRFLLPARIFQTTSPLVRQPASAIYGFPITNSLTGER
jgi:hypothetical protein